MPLVLFKLGFKALKQREGIGGGAGEASQHLAVIELAHLARRTLDHNVPQGDLPVSANGHCRTCNRLAPHADDRRTVKLFHACCTLGLPARKQVWARKGLVDEPRINCCATRPLHAR